MTPERRRATRHRGVEARCLLRIVAADCRTVLGLAVAEEASASGALLLASVALPVGPVLLEPEHSHPLAARLLRFGVLRCQERAKGGYLVAGAFDPGLTDEEAWILVWW